MTAPAGSGSFAAGGDAPDGARGCPVGVCGGSAAGWDAAPAVCGCDAAVYGFAAVPGEVARALCEWEETLCETAPAGCPTDDVVVGSSPTGRRAAPGGSGSFADGARAT